MRVGRVDVPSVANIAQHPQRQDSLFDQLRDLHIAAARFGMYDAADWLWNAVLIKDEDKVNGWRR